MFLGLFYLHTSLLAVNLGGFKSVLARLVKQEICQVDPGGSGWDTWSGKKKKNCRSVGGMEKENVMC
jgi:hypothetical protein